MKRSTGRGGLLAAVTIVALAAASSLAAQNPQPRFVPQEEFYAANLGIHYRLLPYGASLGARITRPPEPGTPAARAGLELGDMLTHLDGRPIFTSNDILSHNARTTVSFLDVRTNQLMSIVVDLPGGPTPPPPPPPQPGPPAYVLGVNVAPVTFRDARSRYLPPGEPNLPPGASVAGLQITLVTPGSAANRAGLEVGDVILTANGLPTTNLEALRAAVSQSKGTLALTIRNARYPYNIASVTTYPQPVTPPVGPGQPVP